MSGKGTIMEAAAQIKRKRSSESPTNWKLCIICQVADKKNILRQISENGISRLREVVSERQKMRDYANWDMLQRLGNVDLNSESQEHDILYHKGCYSSFTSSSHLDRMRKKHQRSETDPDDSDVRENNRATLRSCLPALNTSCCIFCQSTTTEKTSLITTMHVSQKIISLAQKDTTMRCRLAGYSDLVAADARYHLKCYVLFMINSQSQESLEKSDIQQEALRQVIESVSAGTSIGNIYSLADVWDMYSTLLAEHEVEVGSYKVNRKWFKQKLQSSLSNKIDFVPQLHQQQPLLIFPKGKEKELVQTLKDQSDELNDSKVDDSLKLTHAVERDEMLALYHTALKIREDVKKCPSLPDCSTIRSEDAKDMIPNNLYLFLNVLLRGDGEALEEESPTILSVSSHDVSSQQITDALLSAFSRGKAKLKTFLQDRILSNRIGLHEKLEQSKSLTLKSTYETKKISEKGLKTKEVRADRALFQRLLLAKDAGRDVNLKELLCHELSPVPLSIANTAGELHPASKSTLATLLEKDHTYEEIPQTDKQTCTIIDGQALVQSIGKPSGARTFGDLADVFIVAALSNVRNSTRLGVVFDHYNETSIKDGTRSQRTGTTKSIRKEVDGRDVPLPTMWKPFISLSANKADLVHFLSTELISKAQQLYPDVQVVTTGGYKDLLQVGHSQQLQDVQTLSSDHEEADTRILLHAQDARSSGFERLVACCRDTDVLVLLVHYAQDIGGEIWFRTETSQKRRMIAVHEMDIHPVLRSCLPAFHSITGCDTVSQFYGIGKKTAWKVFCSDGFLLSQLGRAPLTDKVISNAEEFICKLYCPGTTDRNINAVRHFLFLKGVTEPEKLPPTHQCLIEHIKRAYYQSSVWYSSLLPIQNLPSPLGYGWCADDTMGLRPEVRVKDPIPVVCTEILHCRCKNCNSGRCSCRAKQMTCTSAWGCSSRMCSNPFTMTDDTLDDDM